MTGVRLGDFVRIRTGKLNANASDENGIYPFFTCAREISRINKFAFDCECVLVAGNGELNVKYYEGKFNAYQRTYVIEALDKNVLSPKFLFYFLDKYVEQLRNGAIGGVIKYIKLNHLTDIDFPLFDIDTQNKIVAILDKANALVQKRQQSIDLLDELLRAQFLEMFGDPISNTKKWETKLLSEVASLERGRFSPRPRNDPSYFGGSFSFIQTGDISKANYRLSEFTQTLNEKGIAVSKEFKQGTIVIAIVGATIGATAILMIDTYATDSIIGIYSNQGKSINIFLEMILRFYKQVLIDKAPEAARANINLAILNKLVVIQPPIELQEKYSVLSNLLEEKRKVLQFSKLKIAELYASILQRSFSGKLNLTVSIELDALLEEIDLQKPENDLYSILSNEEYINSLIERLNTQDFENQDLYDKAKHAAFQLLKTDEIIAQKYDEDAKTLKLVVK